MPEEPTGTIVAEEKQPETIPTSTETQSEEPKLPEDVSERTKVEFEKLKEHNRQLAEQLRQKEEAGTPIPSVLESLKPSAPSTVPASVTSNLTQNQVNDIYSKLTDENGLIDVNLLVSTLREANTRAERAEAKADMLQQRVSQREESQQVRDAHSKYPQLDPKSAQFDPRFYSAVKNEMIGQMMNGEQDFVKAADVVSNWYLATPSDKRQDAAKTKEQQVKQVQAVSAVGGAVKVPDDQDELIRRTRHGDRQAIMERLKRIGQ